MENYDVTMTATLRPELIERTIRSFHENLWKDWIKYARFYVNVDPAGCEDELESDYRKQKIVDFFGEYVGLENVVFNFPLEPHFPTAWLWCIKRTLNRLVFHLEEDWEMNFEQDFGTMVSMFDKYPKLRHLRLSLFVSTKESVKMWGRHFAHWNGDFYRIDEKSVIPVGWCGHPSLNHGGWFRACACMMTSNRNPEKQFHYNESVVDKFIVGKQFGVFHKRGAGRGIRDIGREWMREHGYKKTGGINVEHFTHWEKEKE